LRGGGGGDSRDIFIFEYPGQFEKHITLLHKKREEMQNFKIFLYRKLGSYSTLQQAGKGHTSYFSVFA
jgi:hypothetical protein